MRGALSTGCYGRSPSVCRSRPGTRAKSRRLRVAKPRARTIAVAAMSASGRRIRASRRIRPARSAMARSSGISPRGASRAAAVSAPRLPANRSALVTIESCKRCPAARRRLAPRRWPMNRSVSTRISATVPFVPARRGCVRRRSEGSGQRRLDIGGLSAQVLVGRAANDLSQRDSLSVGKGVDPPPLPVGQVHLGPGARHTAHYTPAPGVRRESASPRRSRRPALSPPANRLWRKSLARGRGAKRRRGGVPGGSSLPANEGGTDRAGDSGRHPAGRPASARTMGFPIPRRTGPW